MTHLKPSLAALAATSAFLLAAPAAQAWYVDISITGAGRVYETTDADELDEHCPDAIEGFASPGTTPTGTLGASCRAGDAGGDYGYGWVVRYVAEAAAGYRFAGWQSDGRTNPGPVLCDGSGGSSSYAGAVCQFATFQNLQTRARFVDDTNPSMSSLTGPNQVVNGPATFTFSAAADPTFRFFECRVGGVHEWQTCSSGQQENPASGTYTFQVRAVDWSGNRSAEWASAWSWTVDKIAPETTLAPSGPSGTFPSTAAEFAFSSNQSGTFVCTLDGVPSACGSPRNYTGLAQGSHTFTVQARDPAGNLDPTPATRTWTVDTVAPETVPRCERALREHDRHDGHLHVLLRARRRVQLPARQPDHQHVVHVTHDLQRPLGGSAHVPGVGARRGPQHRCQPGAAHVDGRHCAAAASGGGRALAGEPGLRH